MDHIVHELLENLSDLDFTDGLSGFLFKSYGYFCDFILELAQARVKELDELLVDNPNIRRGYKVVRKDDKRTLETKFGPLTYLRHYYYSEEKGYKYLIDGFLNVDPRLRVEKGLAAELCMKATDMSYAKSSGQACDGRVSKQTVKNIVHKVKETPLKLKEARLDIKEIHLQCDEDHVSLQKTDKNRTLAKLVTIHEEIK